MSSLSCGPCLPFLPTTATEYHQDHTRQQSPWHLAFVSIHQSMLDTKWSQGSLSFSHLTGVTSGMFAETFGDASRNLQHLSCSRLLSSGLFRRDVVNLAKGVRELCGHTLLLSCLVQTQGLKFIRRVLKFIRRVSLHGLFILVSRSCSCRRHTLLLSA